MWAKYFQWLILGFKGLIDQLGDVQRDSGQAFSENQREQLREVARKVLELAEK